MNPDRWQKIEQIYNTALEYQPDRRDAYLAEACAGDESLRAEVEGLLRNSAGSGDFMKEPALEFAAKALAEDQANQPSMDLAGSTIGHYCIIEKIGQGGMGVVYRARDEHLKRDVAIKVLPAEATADPERKRRFVQEARAASALNHPNIIGIHDINSDAGVDFIAMEYVAGKTLDRRIGRKGLRIGEVLKYAVQIADALAAAHAAGIVHRDLKPSNIIVTKTGLVKVLDFGLAKLTQPIQNETPGTVPSMESLTGEGRIMGTVAYMSPEQAEGKAVDARSDVFSFGSLLYEMLTGRQAFEGDSVISILSAILNKEALPLSPDVPRDLEKIVTRCMRKDPSRRFQAMSDLKVDLEELEEESDSGKLAPAPPAVRRAWPLWATVASALLLATVSTWYWLRRPLAPQPPMKVVQLTSYSGYEMYPCFSPDGNQVAFTWDGEKRDNLDIYVKLVGETNALRLTTDPAADEWPAWSPDGKRIAFQRSGLGRATAIYLVSALGGAERKLMDFQADGQMSWSPDGNWLVVARAHEFGNFVESPGLFLVPIEGGEPRRLTNPKAPGYDIHPSISPDGRLLACAACASYSSCDIYVQHLGSDYAPEGSPRRITQQGFFPAGLAWSRDGESLVYSGSLATFRLQYLWQVGIRGEQPPERFDLAGVGAHYPSIARAGNRLVFTRDPSNYDIWRYQLGGSPQPLIMSSLHEVGPEFSPDGSRIAFFSNRSGEFEIWVANADGSNPVQLTNRVQRYQSEPKWSPDGRWIAFESLSRDGHSDICVIEASGGRPRRLSSEPFDAFMPSWSRDGKWVYFGSNRTGKYTIWRVAFDGGQPEQVTQNGGWTASESQDGKTLFYVDGGDLFAKPLGGGAERQVLDGVSQAAFVVMPDGIYYIGHIGNDRQYAFPDSQYFQRQYALQFFQFSTGTSRLLTKIQGTLPTGLTVSPDRKTFLFANSVTPGPDLMLIENFR